MGGTHALIPAAGSGERFRLSGSPRGPLIGGSPSVAPGTANKLLALLGGQPVLTHTLRAFDGCPDIDGIVVVGSRDSLPRLEAASREAGLKRTVRFVEGGLTRQESVFRGLLALPRDAEIVAVHDAARPLVRSELIARTIEAARKHGAAVACEPVTDTMKRIDHEGRIVLTLTRGDLRAAQTPQTFRVPILLRAHESARRDGVSATDDAALVERLGDPVHAVEGDRTNLKITSLEDLKTAEAFLTGEVTPAPASIRVGFGYDVHRLVEGRRLVLGGVSIPHTKGLDGHSDADVLLHAVMDALLGAAGLSDIGHLFPNTDEQWRGASSRAMLREVSARLRDAGCRPLNVDMTLIAERPMIAPYIAAMRDVVAADLGLPQSAIGVKATTNEGTGSLGREEAMAAYAVALVSTIGR